MAQLNDLIVLGNTSLIGDLSLTINSLSSNGIKYLLTTENLLGSGNQNLKLHEDVYYYYGSSYSSLNVGKSTKNGIITIHNNGYFMDIKPATLSSSNKTITIPNATGTVALLEVANTFSGNNTFSGTNTFSGAVIFSNETDIEYNKSKDVALRIGKTTGTHLAFDGNEIMAKSNGTTAGPLYLNNEGGQVYIGPGGLAVEGATTFSDIATFKKPPVVRHNSSRYGYIDFQNSAGLLLGRIKHDIGHATTVQQSRFAFIEYSAQATNDTTKTEFYEQYFLPASTDGLTANKDYSILTTKSKVTVAQGGTGAGTFTSGHALIGNGTGAIQTRGIRNNTAKGGLGWTSTSADTVLVTANTIAFWDGSYNGSTSNLTKLGTVTTGTWSASTIAVNKGGTGRTTYRTTDYTGNQYRASKIQNTIPTSIDNGCLVYVYVDTTTI